MPVDTTITNCKIARHDGILNAGLAIEQGKVVAIAKDAELPSADTVIDGQGNFIIPGVIDAHVHLEYPPGVDPESNIKRETRACAAAGWKPRISCSLSTASKLKLKNPSSESGKPTLPATFQDSSLS